MNRRFKRITKILLIVLVLGGAIQIGTVLADSVFSKSSVMSYEEWLDVYEIHPDFRNELDRLQAAGHKRSDLMTAYVYLYHQYGQMKELLPMVEAIEKGSSWAKQFENYEKQHTPFAPRAFDMTELENLTSSANLSTDDIMIADRISFVSGDSVKTVLTSKLEAGLGWQEIAAQREILNGSSALPRVEVTEDNIAAYVTASFSDQQVVEGYVLAQKLGKKPDDVISLMKNGMKESAIMAKFLQSQYASY